MFEVEVKIFLQNAHLIRTRLHDLGAKLLNFMDQTDIYYNLPPKWGNFAQTDEVLRLRGTKIIDSKSKTKLKEEYDLTYKGPKIDSISKTRIEHVSRIIDSDQMDHIIERLGFQKIITVKKRRELFSMDYEGQSVELSIDRVEGLEGEYIEAEIGIQKEVDLNKARETIFHLLEKLGYSKSDSIIKSYLELVLEKPNNK
jgi:adenylate cyclase class 2